MWLHISGQAAAFFQEKESKFYVTDFTGKPSHVEKLSGSFQKLPVTLDILCNYRLTLHSKIFRTRSIGWALFGVKFRLLQKIEAMMGVCG